MRVSRRLCVAAAVITLLFALAQTATAIPLRMTYVKKTFTVRPHSIHTAHATCPAGAEITGGGVASSPKVVIMESGVGAIASTMWEVTAVNPTGRKRSVTITADCAKVANLPVGTTFNLSTVQFVTGAAANSSKEICNAGALLGGGFQADTADSAFHIAYTSVSDGPDFDSDRNDAIVVGYDNETGVSVNLTIEAICMTSTAGMTYVDHSVNAAANSFTTVSASCPSGTRVTGGGAELPNPEVGGIMRATKPTGLGSTPPGTGWSSTVDPGPTLQVLTAVAACMSLS